jgi:hypothetical protein
MTSPNLSFLRTFERHLPIRTRRDFHSAVNFRQSARHPVHRWFRYREGFSPSILDTISGARRIYDPFAGCGTTLTEAKQRGLAGIGTEINPLAVFVGRVKTADYSTRDTKTFREVTLAAAYEKAPVRWPRPQMRLLPKLFQPVILQEVLRIRANIEACSSAKVRKLLLLSWINILERCSNVFKEGNGLKYRNKRRQPGHYETIPDSIWVPRYFGGSLRTFVRNAWLQQCQEVDSDLRSLNRPKIRSDIYEISCFNADLHGVVGQCDASVFSPPYANRFDYFEAFKLELWMGGFVSSSEEVRRLRQLSMRNNLTVADGDFDEWEPLEKVLTLMDEGSSSVRMGIKNTLRGYFEDVKLLAHQMRQVIKPGGKVVCVIGNSAYAGVVIPTDLFFAKIFAEQGFRVRSVNVARHLPVSSQQRARMEYPIMEFMRESVIVCTN